jgi:glycosyltransferase involved in cell wall biosynthesis
MRILLIVPLPPPITGHSLVSQMLVDGLAGVHETDVVNLSVGSLNDGRVTVRRIHEVVKILLAVWRRKAGADAIYLTISESLAGNVKDLFIYLLCVGRLSRVFLHLHGGTIGRELFDRHSAWRRLNAAFIQHVGGVIISGPAHHDIFAGMIDDRRVHVVPNSAGDDLFVPEPHVPEKFACTRPLRMLYISSMTEPKGYLDLLNGWLALAPEVRQSIQVDFAGRFETEADRIAFLDRIAGLEGVRYRGLVDPECKRQLFAQAHVFCLPTRMFEGQPISILEAYAAGCVVITTAQRGICDVFTDGVNGFEVAEGSPSGMASVLFRLLDDDDRLRQIAIANRRTAGERYRSSTFTAALRRILESAAAA